MGKDGILRKAVHFHTVFRGVLPTKSNIKEYRHPELVSG
jgi:hypothetical protein